MKLVLTLCPSQWNGFYEFFSEDKFCLKTLKPPHSLWQFPQLLSIAMLCLWDEDVASLVAAELRAPGGGVRGALYSYCSRHAYRCPILPRPHPPHSLAHTKGIYSYPNPHIQYIYILMYKINPPLPPPTVGTPDIQHICWILTASYS